MLVPQDPTDEASSKLLEKIEVDKKRLVKDKKIKKGKPIQAITEFNNLYGIPASWEWVRVGTLFYDLRYGTSKKCSYEKTDFPVLRIPNIANGSVGIEDLKYTTLTEKEVNDLALGLKDMLAIRSNGSVSLVGRTAVVPDHAIGFAFAGYLMRMRFPREHVNSDFIHLAFESTFVRKQIEQPIRTTSGVKNINSTEIANLIISLPPLPEQAHIVDKVNELMALCDQLEANIRDKSETSTRYAEAIIQQIAAA
ncbi:MAG: restriction endonuclease subunit S [Chromatiales bacterium]